jgi:broad specificity phosphatase PhoE
MTTRFFWVRHGPTHRKTMIGWTDVPADLSDRPALDRLARELPPEASVVSSDLMRAVATADALERGRPRLGHDAALREINFGAWEDRLFTDVARETPELARAFLENPGPWRAPGGESWNDLEDRVTAAVDDLAARHQGGTVVVVAHFAVILTALRRARGITPYDAMAQKIDNLSLTELTRTRGGWQVGRINRLV